MVQYELNYIEKNAVEFNEKSFKNVDEALKFIDENAEKMTYYTLWKIDAQIIATK